MDTHSLLWLVLGLYMLHELEEIGMIRPWIAWVKRTGNKRAATNPFAVRYADKRGEVAALVIAEQTLLIIVIILVADIAGVTAALVGFLVVYTLHLVGHLAETARAWSYTPGVVTAAATLPFFGWFLARADWTAWPEIVAWTIGVGAVMAANFGLIFWLEPRLDQALARLENGPARTG